MNIIKCGVMNCITGAEAVIELHYYISPYEVPSKKFLSRHCLANIHLRILKVVNFFVRIYP